MRIGLNFTSISIVALTLIIKFSYPTLAKRFGLKIHIPASFVALSLVSIIVSAFSILVAIESLLSARVADAMAHEKMSFEPNRELFGQGLSTMIASLFGGMPATGAIARSSVNVRSHAKSRLASIFHAVVLLIIALIAAPLVSQIPMAVVAGLLLGTSYRIFNPTSIMESLRTTKSEASTIIVTAISSVVIDLIWGIAIGITLHVILEKINKRTSKV